MFEDTVFPPSSSSLLFSPGRPGKDTGFKDQVAGWRRPSQWSSNSRLFKKGVECSDVEQGALGDCWLLAACSTVATHPRVLERVFVHSDLENGEHTVRLYWNGAWHEVTVDDLIPCNPKGQPAFGHNADPDECWVVILEKAVAKLLGTYQALHGGYYEVGLQLLTGGRPERLYMNNADGREDKNVWRPDQLWDRLLQYHEEDVLMGCSISSGREEKNRDAGVVAGHAYSLLDIRETRDGHCLLKLRNPWGMFEWRGAFSDRDTRRWTSSLLKELDYKRGDDGVFWMEFRDFKRIYDKVSCLHVFNDALLTMPFDRRVSAPTTGKHPQAARTQTRKFPKSRWQRRKYRGQWDGATAGGMAIDMSFAANPHLRLSLDRESRVFLTVLRDQVPSHIEAQHFRTAIGFVLQRGGVDQADLQHVPRTNTERALMMTPVPAFYNAVEVTLDAGEYVVTPCTFFPNRKGEFTMEVYAPHAFDLMPLPGHGTTLKEAQPSIQDGWEGEGDDDDGDRRDDGGDQDKGKDGERRRGDQMEERRKATMTTSMSMSKSDNRRTGTPKKGRSTLMSTYQWEFGGRYGK
eukprot:gb/GECH01011999.1/.p1 GENE.gb/GECH01011999.1/~~gb/GECH01011999.1/.p1  ORF type:complete len:575 (+),score=114.10 gb/GECH01011999.1/:1-1725(+)